MMFFNQKSICLFGLWALFVACILSTFAVGHRLFSVPNKAFKKSKVTTESIVNDLHHRERNVLAIGMVNDKLTVFVSDHRYDLVGGYRLEVYPSDAGRLQVSSHPIPLPGGVPSGSVNFVCKDSSGSSLVVMDNAAVHRIALPSNSIFSVDMNSTASSYCYSGGSLHVSSSSLLHYYVITSDGKVTLDGFVGDPIASSKQCLDPDPQGLLCFSSTTVTMTKDPCSGTFPKDLTAGYIDHRGVYLFDESNTAYVFSRKVFDSLGSSVDLFQFDSGQIFHFVKTTPKFAPCKMKYELPPRPWWHDWIVTICGYANFAIIGLVTMAAIWLTHFNRQRRRMREIRQAAAAAAEARGIAGAAVGGQGRHDHADGGLRNRNRGGRRTSRSRSRSRARSRSHARSRSRSRSPRGSTSPNQRRTATTSQPVWKTKTKKTKKGKKGGKKGSKKGGGKQKRR